MAMEWDKDPEHLKEQFARAYGSGTASSEELARRRPTIITFDDRELKLQRAKAHDMISRLGRD